MMRRHRHDFFDTLEAGGFTAPFPIANYDGLNNSHLWPTLDRDLLYCVAAGFVSSVFVWFVAAICSAAVL